MSEDPIKLFSTRAERYPQPDDTDQARTAIEKIVEQVPVLGPATVYVVSQFLMPAYQRRQEEWFKELADDIDRLAATVDGFKVENLQHNEVFVSAVIQATRIAVSTHREEKRRYLRNALLNIALGNGPGDDLQQIFLNAIDAFTPSHIVVLNVLWRGTALVTIAPDAWAHQQRLMGHDYSTAIRMLYPDLKGPAELIKQIFTELFSRGFSKLNDAKSTFPSGPAITNLGISFLHFVLSDEELPK